MSTPFDEAFVAVGRLAANFRAHESRYLATDYSEAEARKDFIDKFWTALGWDVDHVLQHNPYEQEVKVERNVVDQLSKRRADYAFYLAPNYRDPKFFVEAKKPSKDIGNDNDYFQAIRYGWNTSTPLVVLTDFEQFHVLDCRYKPDIKTALQRAVPELKFHYSDYENKDKFAQLYWLFSREAVANDSINKHAAGLSKRKGKQLQRGLLKGGEQKIDEVFLEELDGYRETLAKAFKNQNESLDGETLTEIVQRTLDRLVFLKFLEDKLIETNVRIGDFGKGGNAWHDFIGASRKLDAIYNGIVFKQHKLLDDPGFKVDEADFSGICDELARDQSPYDFNLIPIHILGSIYERFLGKVITTTDKRARVEEKPEVRKAGGVYYTPEYIVRYIVAQTVGKLIEGKAPKEISALHFADIACGSGSFLLDVFDCLLRYHRDWYNKHPDQASGITGKKGKVPEVFKHDDGTLHLTLAKKSEILLNNIYGVDIDQQACEVTQLSLYLKLLEEETPGSTRGHLSGFGGALLPSLNKNIVCGNSLIGTDILDGQMFEAVEERKLNPMNFEAAFPEVMKRGGFDAIVGNPPYGAYLHQSHKQYLTQKFTFQSYQLDSYLLFLERAIKDLIRPTAFVGLIIPNPWLTNLLQVTTRKYVCEKTCVHEIVHFKSRVFQKVTVDTQIVILQKADPKDWKCVVTIVDGEIEDGSKIVHAQDKWRNLQGGVINIFTSEAEEALARKISSLGASLEAFCNINVGIKPYQTGKGVPAQTKETVEQRPFDADQKVTSLHRQYLRGRDIKRYLIAPIEAKYIKYGNWLAEPRPAANFDAPIKLVMRQTGDSLVCAMDKQQFLCLNNMHVLVPSENSIAPEYLLGLINSKLMNWYYRVLNPEVGEALAEVKKTNVAKLPIKKCVSKDTSNCQRITDTAKQILNAKQKLSVSSSEKDQNYWQGRCDDLDRKIDGLVYELYGLTEDEIRIVEGSPA